MRERGYRGGVVVFGREGRRPCELPALSKDMLPGDADAPNRAHEPDLHENGRIELRIKIEITRLDVGERVILGSAGARHSYDRLILATDSTPRRLPVARV